MFEKYKLKRSRKKEIAEQVRKDKIQSKELKKQLSSMSEEERIQKKAELKEEKNSLKQKQKMYYKTADKKERKQIKKDKKIYRKIKRRPIKLSVWAIIASLFLVTFINYFPFISNIYVVLSGRDVTAITNTPEGIAARQEGEVLAKQISDEGIVLLKNEENHLPLDTPKINIFGVSAMNFRYGGGGSGGVDSSRAINLFDGLNDSGIEYNAQLYDFYEELLAEDESKDNQSGVVEVVSGMFSSTEIDEPSIDYLNDNVLESAQEYSDNAMIVIAADGVEASDLSADQLKLTDNKRALIERITDLFDNVTIVINAGNALDLSFIEEYPSIKSVVWTGTPGTYGTRSLGEVLSGTLNPSGRLVDTYSYDIDSAPASVNFGDFKYENTDKAFLNYQEGIYVGYRFYETYYDEDEEGYSAAVQFPFGYGLSYTDFDWTVTDTSFDEDTVEVEVEVTNTGDVSGKEVVQVYYSAPYIEGGIEKSSIELAAFSKTDLLQPEESQTLTITYDTTDMASYDMVEEEAYVLDDGTYEIHLAENVHDIRETFEYDLSSKIIIDEDPETQMAYENQFDDARGDIDYLSRSDFEGTYPSLEDVNYQASDEVLESLNEDFVETNDDEPEFGIDHDITLEDLKGLQKDDALWDQFMEQFTYKELRKFVTHGAYKTVPVERLGVPQTLLMDGPAGFNYFFGSMESAAYPAQSVVASTWNTQLAYEMGESAGKEARAYGIKGWYAPALNLHRTPLGGRNFEYLSEDPLLNGKIGAAISKGAQEQGVTVFLKHFALNEQETNARSGILVWSNEQAIRELHLKPFEIAVKEADAKGVMSSFSYIGTKWAGENKALLQNVLREEWGFDGFVSSDAVFGFMDASKAITSGNDLMLDVLTPSVNMDKIDKSFEKDPVAITEGLRTSVKNILFTLLQTNLNE